MPTRDNPRHIAVQASSVYGLTAPRVRLLHAGYNSTYQVDAAEGRFALRVTRLGPTRAHVLAEVAWMDALRRDTAIRLPEIRRDRGGSPVVTVEDRHCVLAGWIDGAQRSKGLTPRMLSAVGATLATLHMQAERWTPPTGWRRAAFDGMWLGAPDPRATMPPEYAAAFTQTMGLVEPVLARLRAAPRHVIHADLHQGNYRFARGVQIGIIDFDDCAIGHPAQDIAITLYYLQKHPRFEALWAGLKAGYAALRPWPADPETIWTLIAWRTLHLCADLKVHPDPGVRALEAEMLPKWMGRLERVRARLARL